MRQEPSENRTWDFTFAMYRQLCDCLLGSGYQLISVRDYFLYNVQNSTDFLAILRHDVDRRPTQALALAQMEHALGIHSTYYFRKISHVFHPQIICSIAHMGHEVGYHYEVLTKTRGKISEAVQLFSQELSDFRRIVVVDTACMHGSPLSRWDSRNIWSVCQLSDFGLLGEPYLSMDFTSVSYFTDTGRCWNGRKYNVRDRVLGNDNRYGRIRTTREVMKWIQKKSCRVMMIQTHPERWTYSVRDYLWSYGQDMVANSVKRMIVMANRLIAEGV